MIITSKLMFRTLVVLIGLGIFVRGIWINLCSTTEVSPLDTINACISFIVAGVTIAASIVVGALFLLDIIISFIQDLWAGQRQLFKPFKINFKFKK